jgi:hypothetical protein
MHALTPELDSGTPTESFLRVLDEFASLRSYAADVPAVGGYRLLSPRRHVLALRAPSAASVAALARARMRLTGFLSVLFVGGLGLAVLAGPANCPCSNTFTVADRAAFARLGYVENAGMLTERESQRELPAAATATLLEPEAGATSLAPIAEANSADAAPIAEASSAAASPITTASLEPPRAAPLVSGDALPAADVDHSPRLPEAVADQTPAPVKLAAAPSVESDVPPTLPVVEIATPPPMEITATDAAEESPPASKPQSVRKRVTRAARTKRTARAYRSAPIMKKKVDPTAPTPPPKWAQQMFSNPWQSQAFSYTR